MELLLGPLLGEGGFARVRQALDPVQRRHYAWKELAGDKKEQPYIAAHQAEAWIMSQVAHPIIPRVYGHIRERNAYLMDLLLAISVDEIASAIGRSPRGIRFKLGLDLVDAIAQMHRKGFLHLDIKLANLLLSPYGNLYLIDFGVTAMHWVRTKLQRPIDIPVTPQYAPPESFDADVVPAPEVDVYALGVSLYRILTGRRPYNVPAGQPHQALRAILEAHRSGRIVHPSELDGAIPKPMGDVVMRAMNPEAAERYHNAGMLKEALIRCLGSVRVASRGDTERWASDLLEGPLAGKVPALWHGDDPVESMNIEDEDLEVQAPVIPVVASELMVTSEAVRAPGKVDVEWRTENDVEGYDVRLLTPERSREKAFQVSEGRFTIDAGVPGTYVVRVRARRDGLGGPWTAPLEITVASGTARWVFAMIAFMIVALSVSAWLVWDLTRPMGSQRVPESEAVAVAGSKVQPGEAVQRSRERPPYPTPTATFSPTRLVGGWEKGRERPPHPTSTPAPIAMPMEKPAAAHMQLQTPSASAGKGTASQEPAVASLTDQTPVPETKQRQPSVTSNLAGSDAAASPDVPANATQAGVDLPRLFTAPSQVHVNFNIMVLPTNLKIARINGMKVAKEGYRVKVEGSVLHEGENTISLKEGGDVVVKLNQGKHLVGFLQKGPVTGLKIQKLTH